MHIKLNKGLLRYYLTLVAANGETLMVSQKYLNKSNAMRAARRLNQEIPSAMVKTGGL